MGTTFAAGIAEVMGVLMIGLLALVLSKAQRDKRNPINLAYLLVDPAVANVTLGKFGGFVALLTTTWIVIYEAVDKSLTDITFAAYVAAWGAVKVATDFVNAKKTDAPSGS